PSRIPDELLLPLWSAFEERAGPLLSALREKVDHYSQAGHTDKAWAELLAAGLALGRCLCAWAPFGCSHALISGDYGSRAIAELCEAALESWREQVRARATSEDGPIGVRLRNAALGLAAHAPPHGAREG